MRRERAAVRLSRARGEAKSVIRGWHSARRVVCAIYAGCAYRSLVPGVGNRGVRANEKPESQFEL